MQCRRTANAGVLLTLDGVNILLDGVCRQVGSYMATPDEQRRELLACMPDVVAFTHGHLDHFDRSYAHQYNQMTLRSILGPEGLLKEGLCTDAVRVGNVTVTPIPTRHIGKAGEASSHVSYLICGSQRILFTGDATPSAFKDLQVDLLIAPYAYAATRAGWRAAGQLADRMILLHLPDPANDPDGLWQAVRTVTSAPGPALFIPAMGETLTF